MGRILFNPSLHFLLVVYWGFFYIRSSFHPKMSWGPWNFLSDYRRKSLDWPTIGLVSQVARTAKPLQQDPTRPEGSLGLLRKESTNPSQEILSRDPEIKGLPGILRYCNVFSDALFVLSLPSLSLDVTP